MSSDPERRRRGPSRARTARALIAALCALSLTLAPLVAPSAGVAQSFGSGPTTPQSGPPNIEPPGKPPGGGRGGGGGGGEGRFPCRSSVGECLQIIKQFCRKVEESGLGNCADLAKEFLDTKKGDPRKVLGNDKNGHVPDLAFQAPYFGVGFQVHHIVPQGEPFFGVARFAQSILQRVGIKRVQLSQRDVTRRGG